MNVIFCIYIYMNIFKNIIFHFSKILENKKRRASSLLRAPRYHRSLLCLVSECPIRRNARGGRVSQGLPTLDDHGECIGNRPHHCPCATRSGSRIGLKEEIGITIKTIAPHLERLLCQGFRVSPDQFGPKIDPVC